MISTVSYNIFACFCQHLDSIVKKNLLVYQSIFGHLQSNLSVAPQANAALIGTRLNRIEQCQVNMLDGVKHTIIAIPTIDKQTLQHLN